MSNLLAVDFDMFFPNPWGDPDGTKRRDILLYDWGHREAPFFIDGPIWTSRGAGFVMHDMPLPDLNGKEASFWERFKIAKGAKLYYADSNACAVNPLVTGRSRRWDSVWLYDAHHDSGYKADPNWDRFERTRAIYDLLMKGLWACEDWMVLYHSGLGAKLHVRYPEWRAWAMDGEPEPLVDVDRQVDDGSTPDVVFDRIFVCRSGAWVPPWLDIDERFLRFVREAPVREDRKTNVQPGATDPREFDVAWVEQDVANWRTLNENLPEGARVLGKS